MKCPSCQKPKPRGKYLCSSCWFALPEGSRRALNRKDRRAGARLIELHHQLADGVPVHEVRIEVSEEASSRSRGVASDASPAAGPVQARTGPAAPEVAR